MKKDMAKKLISEEDYRDILIQSYQRWVDVVMTVGIIFAQTYHAGLKCEI